MLACRNDYQGQRSLIEKDLTWSNVFLPNNDNAWVYPDINPFFKTKIGKLGGETTEVVKGQKDIAAMIEADEVRNVMSLVWSEMVKKYQAKQI
jgi:hypothetical protein